MAEKRFIITLDADNLTPELAALLNAQGAEIRSATSQNLQLSLEREAEFMRDLDAFEAGEAGNDLEVVVAQGRAFFDSPK